jgi:RNA polymerase sigma-70 factor (ECF subfamily)
MGVEPDIDAELMLRVKRGETGAFEALVEKYKQPVINLVYRSVGDLAEAEDVAQNVFVQAFKAASRYQPTAKFSTWLFTIARNLCLNEIRRRARHPAESLEADKAEDEESSRRQYADTKLSGPAEEMLQAELQEKISAVLAGLPENQRTAILLFREQDMSYEDIARILGTTLAATKSLMHRARETLKQQLKPYLRTGEWE